METPGYGEARNPGTGEHLARWERDNLKGGRPQVLLRVQGLLKGPRGPESPQERKGCLMGKGCVCESPKHNVIAEVRQSS